MVDEIYLGLSFANGPIRSALALGENVISINSFSKYFNMTGWRLGWMVVPEALASRALETVSALRLFNPQLARYPATAPLPAGVVIQLPAIGVADALAVGLPLLVPQVELGDPLPVGGWVLLPPQRGLGGLAEF